MSSSSTEYEHLIRAMDERFQSQPRLNNLLYVDIVKARNERYSTVMVALPEVHHILYREIPTPLTLAEMVHLWRKRHATSWRVQLAKRSPTSITTEETDHELEDVLDLMTVHMHEEFPVIENLLLHLHWTSMVTGFPWRVIRRCTNLKLLVIDIMGDPRHEELPTYIGEDGKVTVDTEVEVGEANSIIYYLKSAEFLRFLRKITKRPFSLGIFNIPANWRTRQEIEYLHKSCGNFQSYGLFQEHL